MWRHPAPPPGRERGTLPYQPAKTPALRTATRSAAVPAADVAASRAATRGELFDNGNLLM